MNKRSLLIGTGLVAGLLLVLFAVLYLNGSFSPQDSHVSWQIVIPHFATGLTAADGKAFAIDISGGIGAYDAENGNHIWGGSVGGYFAAGIAVGDGRVCGGTGYATVGGLDEASGQSLWSFHTPQDLGKQAPESISIVDGRVVATGRFGMGFSITVHNVTDGQLIWEAFPYTVGNITNERDWSVSGFPLGGVPFEGNSIFASNSDSSGTYIFKLDADNGNILWRANTSRAGSVLAIYKEQVVIQSGNLIFSLNKNSGSAVWNYDVGTSIYQPTATYNGLLLFGASDGNFYALHLIDGTLAWKTHVDSENFLALINSDNHLTVYPTQVNPQNDRIFYAFAITEQLGTSSENKHDRYIGFVTCLNLATGDRTWTTKFETAGLFYDTPVGLVVNKNTVYLTSNTSLWTFTASTGNTLGVQNYDHYVLPPVILDDKVFVAADLHLTAYG